MLVKLTSEYVDAKNTLSIALASPVLEYNKAVNVDEIVFFFNTVKLFKAQFTHNIFAHNIEIKRQKDIAIKRYKDIFPPIFFSCVN